MQLEDMDVIGVRTEDAETRVCSRGITCCSEPMKRKQLKE